MKRRINDTVGQVFTIEGVVAALILIVALSYIMTSITFVSPQTEKSTSTKLDIRAHDTLNVLATDDQPGNHINFLKTAIASWDGNEPVSPESMSPAELSLKYLNDNISMVTPDNVNFNAYAYYYDDSGVLVKKTLIYHGEPEDNAGMTTKLLVMNKNDTVPLSPFWKAMTLPKSVEIKLVMWPV